jgi:nucleoid-associated protein YgaU
MGREAKLLLALLGLLTGVLVGVVSMKLFVPRPPIGAGPDIHGDLSTAEIQELVEPPALSLPARSDFESAAIAPPESAEIPASRFTPVAEFRHEPIASDPEPRVIASIPATTTAALADPIPESVAVRDPFVSPAAFESERELPPVPAELVPTASESSAHDLVPPPTPVVASAAGFAPAGYVAQPGDSWWSLAERTYGDGRLYRVLFAWNRARDPRISLVPGTRLELPPADRLAAAWPGLMPRE